MNASLRRRLEKAASAFFCPNCGFKLRRHVNQHQPAEPANDEFRKALEGATDEELEALSTLIEKIQARHKSIARNTDSHQ